MAEGGGGALREILAVFGFDIDVKELEKGENKLGEFFEKVKGIGEGIAAAFAVDQLFEFVEAQARAITAIEHMAAQVGISTEAVQAWQYAAKASGFEAEKFTTAMSRLQVAAGSEQGAKSFEALGISVKDATGHSKDAAALFSDVAEAVKNTEDPNKRAAIATKLFGRAGRELLPFLSEGRAGIDELMDAYKELGGAYTDADIERTKEFEKAQAGLGLTWTSLKATITRVLMPAFTTLMRWMTTAVKTFVEVVQRSYAFQAALVVLGAAATVFAVQMAIASAPILLMAAALAAIVLAVDEVITTFEGGDSVLRDAIDNLFGKGATAEGVEHLRDTWKEIVGFVKESYEWLKRHTDELMDIWKVISIPLKMTLRAATDTGDLIGYAAGKDAQREAEMNYTLAHPEAASSGGSRGDRAKMHAAEGGNYFPSPFSDSPFAPYQGNGLAFQTPSPLAPAGANATTHTTVVHIDGDAIRPEMVKITEEHANKANRAHADALQRGTAK
jgi:hypothetical protein